jgi:hypothetical protein
VGDLEHLLVHVPEGAEVRDVIGGLDIIGEARVDDPCRIHVPHTPD